MTSTIIMDFLVRDGSGMCRGHIYSNGNDRRVFNLDKRYFVMSFFIITNLSKNPDCAGRSYFGTN